MSSLAFASIESWEYRDIANPPPRNLPAAPMEPIPPPGLTEQEVAQRVSAALREAEERWAVQAKTQEAQRQTRFAETLAAFAAERTAYFQRVEAEVVSLALAIARKILQREAELDPTLLGALVRIALDRMGAAPAVRLRVSPQALPWWQQHNGFTGSRYGVELTPDASLELGDCLVETDLGAANFGFESQLKEVEQGLFDLLAQRPEAR